MNTTINNGTNFQAKLNIKYLNGDRNRLKQIAEAFEESTKLYPNDEFLLKGSFKKGIECFRYDKNGNEISSDGIHLNSGITKIMQEFSNSKIAKKLRQLFMLRVKVDKMEADAARLAKRNKLGDDKFDGYTDDVLKNKKQVIEETLKKDFFFGKLRNCIEFTEY